MVELRPFFCSKFEVSAGQLKYLAETLPLTPTRQPLWHVDCVRTPTQPAGDIDWESAVQILAHLSLQVPTGLQWRYACAAPADCDWWMGQDSQQLVAIEHLDTTGVAPWRTRAVDAAPAANSFGLLDLHGNVSEWLADVHGVVLPAPRGAIAVLAQEKQAERVAERFLWAVEYQRQ